MAKSANDIKQGDLIDSPNRHQGLVYVHQVITHVGDGNVAESYVVFPVIAAESFDRDSAGIIPVEQHELTDRNHDIQNLGRLEIILNSTPTTVSVPENHMIEHMATTDGSVIIKVSNVYDAMGGGSRRVSDFERYGNDVPIPGMNLDNYTGGRVIGEGNNEAFRNTEPKSKRSYTRAASSFSSVDDIYLEDALKAKLIDEEIYQFLKRTTKSKEIFTLREAFALAVNPDKKLFKRLTKIKNFEDSFPKQDRNLEDKNLDIHQNPVISHARTIAVDAAYKRGLLVEKTSSVLSQQDDTNRNITSLGEGIELMIVNEDYLGEYKFTSGRKLRSETRRNISADYKAAYNKLIEQDLNAIKDTQVRIMSERIIEAYKQFIQIKDEFTTAPSGTIEAGKTFKRHDPSQKVLPKLKAALATQKGEIRANAPNRLTFS